MESDSHVGTEGRTEENERPFLEKKDSCYDSDEENGRSDVEAKHRDVSRTASETLKDEYDSTPSISNDRYREHLTFALKLGYSENQVQKALTKLGNNVAQNDLLAELIRLGSTPDFENRAISQSNLDKSLPNPRSPFTIGVEESASIPESTLRHIIVDGSNVAMCHGHKILFSCRGIQLCVDYFRQRGHKEITVFVPQWRKEASRPDAPIKDQEVLLELEREGHLIFTPSRYVGGRRLVCYDDRYILKLAVETDGIIVSNDTYRDLLQENPEYKRAVEERLLMFSFVNNRFMPPDDPLGRHGPSLDQFLSRNTKPAFERPVRPCPYGKKCTYGNKCKFAHPERGNRPHKTVTEMIEEKARHQLEELQTRQGEGRSTKTKLKATLSSPAAQSNSAPIHKPLARTRSVNPLAVSSTSNTFGMENPFIQEPQMHRAFLPAPQASSLYESSLLSGFDEISHNVDQLHLFDEPHSHRSSPSLQLPTFDAFHSSFSDLSSAGSVTHRGIRAHQPLGQTYSDSSVHTRPLSGHNRLQRQLSLNPFAPDATSSHQRNPFDSGRRLSRIDQSPAIPADDHQFFSTHTDREFLRNLASDPFFGSEQVVPDEMSLCTQSERGMFRLPSMFPERDAQRIELYQRMSALFPSEQVRAVLDYYPNETSLHRLCAALLQMFPDGERR